MSRHWDSFGPPSRRTLRVGLTAVLSMALCVLYLLGDAFDIVPGYLTYARQPSASLALVRPQSLLVSSPFIRAVDSGKLVDPTAAQALANALAAAPGVGPDLSVIIADGQGKEVVATNPAVAREPASTLKTLTGLAAAQRLDMRATLDTQVFLTQQAGGSAQVTLRGNGDMMLGAGPSDPAHVNGRAGLQSLTDSAVAQLRRRGVSSVKVSYDDSLFGTERMPASMDPDMVSNGNFTPTASMAIDQGKQWGSVPRPTDPDALPRVYPARSLSPAADVAQLFVAQLKGAGLTVAGPAGPTSLPPATLKDSSALIATVSSAPLWQLLRFTLEQSDNTYADLLGRLLALKLGTANSPAGAAAAVLQVLKETGVALDGAQLADCSGLAAGSSLTARTLVDVQEKYFSTANAAALEGLAVSGFSGTALEHGFGADVSGLIRLKTGTLPTVTSMTGSVLRKGGGLLFYAVIVNKPANMWSAQKAEDGFVSALAGL